jgi:predicted DCC family thiol-disulfide oxidoreductase YuxK
MEQATINFQEASFFQIVCDDRCAMVRRLASIVKKWDRHSRFHFIRRSAHAEAEKQYLRHLDESPWSLVLLDNHNNVWAGPEAIPFILKNLPFGKIAAVLYILPGTMFVTRQFYHVLSRNRAIFAERHPADAA